MVKGRAPRRWSEEVSQLEYPSSGPGERGVYDGAGETTGCGTTSTGTKSHHAAAPERAAARLPVGHYPTHLVRVRVRAWVGSEGEDGWQHIWSAP